MSELHERIAVRAYFLARAGIGTDDLDRWLTAEAREVPQGIEAPKPAAKRKAKGSLR